MTKSNSSPGIGLAARLDILADRTVAVAEEAGRELRQALNAYDDAQRELEAAESAKGDLEEQRQALKVAAGEIRLAQNFDDESSILKSAVADRKLELFTPKIERADHFISESQRAADLAWGGVRGLARKILEAEYETRAEDIRGVMRLLFSDASPEFLAASVANSTVTKPLAGVLWLLVNALGERDTLHGDPSQVIPIARRIAAGDFAV